MKVTFNQLKLKPKEKTIKTKIMDGVEVEVLQYLPQTDKADFIQFVIENSIDESNGCSSPIRTDTYFGIAIAKWYAGIRFTEGQIKKAPIVYDALQTNGIIDKIVMAIPDKEYDFILNTTIETIKEYSRYMNSTTFALSNMAVDASELGKNIDKMLADIENSKGIEQLAEIKNIVG